MNLAGDPGCVENVSRLHDRLDEQQWQQQQQRQEETGTSFAAFYAAVCDKVRSAEGGLDTVMEVFGKCVNDQARICYMWQMTEVRQLRISPNTSSKSHTEAESCEELYDMLVTCESNAMRSLEVIQRAILKTPAEDFNDLARRYMKRAWVNLLLERFDAAYVDANRSLHLSNAPETLWNAHEILGHCHAKMKDYKTSEVNFNKALESLRKSNATNAEKAAVAGRVSTVFRMVKEENKPKNRAKETAKKQQEAKMSKLEKTKNKNKSTSSTDEADPAETKEPHVPKLSYGCHRKIESASAAVSVMLKEGRGRCVLANRDIKPGSVIMVEQPYAFVVSSDQLHMRCNTCCSRTCTGLPCSKCAVVVYCSKACVAAGAAVHRLECSVMTQLYDAAMGKVAPLVFRLLSTVPWVRLRNGREHLTQSQQQEDEHEEIGSAQRVMASGETKKWRWNGQYTSKDYLPTFYLVTNSFKRSFGDLFKRAVTAVYVTHCLLAAGYFGSGGATDDELQFVASLALRHLQSSSCNAYEISEMQQQKPGNIGENQSVEVGGAIYPTISLTNHSCYPNVARYNVGNACILRATRFIPKGGEILDNYGFYFHVMDITQRRDGLRAQYKFECCCEACVNQWPQYPHRHGEPILFRCPVATCNSTSSFLDGRRTECSECGDKEHYYKLVLQIKASLDDYSLALSLMHKCRFEEALQVLLRHLNFLEPHAVYPAKHYTDVQEMVRQCYCCLANTYKKEAPPNVL